MADGHPLAMEAHRAGSGARLALVGGGLTGRASWEPHQRRLAATRDVARLQPLSVQYGLENRALPEGYSVRTESRALAAALDGLGWTEAVDVAAWSFGALVALDFALGEPGRIRTLTLIEPPALWVLPEQGGGDPELLALVDVLRTLRGEITGAQLAAWARAVGLVPPGTEPESLPQWAVWMEHRDDPARLDAFPRPVLLVTGTGTPRWLRRITDVLAERLPDARLLELPAGHAPQLVSQDRFLEAMAAFQASA